MLLLFLIDNDSPSQDIKASPFGVLNKSPSFRFENFLAHWLTQKKPQPSLVIPKNLVFKTIYLILLFVFKFINSI